jgi:hypothetical protein
MSTIRRIGAIAAIAGAATVAFANSASADPQKGESLDLTCGDDVYDAVVFSNGLWSPALDANSNVVLHPVAFENRVVRANGQIVDQPPDIAKNGERRGIDVLECTFEQEFEVDTPGGPVTITVTGTVFGFASPKG